MNKIKYKNQEYSIQQFVEIVQKLSKDELTTIVDKPSYTHIIAEYVKQHPKYMKKGSVVITKK